MYTEQKAYELLEDFDFEEAVLLLRAMWNEGRINNATAKALYARLKAENMPTVQ